MDFIKLERAPLPPSSSLIKKQGHKMRAPPLLLASSRSMGRPVENHDSSTTSFKTLCNRLYHALPIPPNAVPILASAQEIKRYESMFEKPWRVIQNLKVKDVLEAFDGISGKTELQAACGKALFLSRFITKLTKQHINFDLAIVCHSLDSERKLNQTLSGFNFNTERITRHYGNCGVFGLMVKIRASVENPQFYTPISRSTVDLIYVYDSACHMNHDSEYQIFQGIHFPKPPLVYLVPMDCAEIRIHTYNRFIRDESKRITWDTLIGEIDRNLQEILFLQPNRKPNNIFCTGWNDYLSQALYNWANTKINEEYVHRFQTKGGLIEQVKMFKFHHPLAAPPPAPVTKRSISSTASPQTPSATTPPRTLKVATIKAENALNNAIKANSQMPPAAKLYPVPSTIGGNHSGGISSGNSVAAAAVSRAAPSATANGATAGGIYPERMTMMMQNSNSTTDTTDNAAPPINPVQDLTSMDWKGATGSNTSTVAESLKRVRDESQEDNGTPSSKAAKITESTHIAEQPIRLSINQQAQNFGFPLSSNSNTAAAPYYLQNTSLVNEAAVTSTAPPQQETTAPPTAEPTLSLGADYDDFIEKALKQFEADVLGLDFKL